MSANVETMIYTQEQPWHGLGKYLGDQIGVTTQQAIEADPKIGSNVNAMPLVAKLPNGLVTDVPGSYAMVREFDSKVVGVVGEQFKKSEMQPSRMFEFFDNVLGEGQARIHTAGLLDEGRRLWILAKLAGADIRIGRSDDIIEKYLLLATGFDGSLNLTGFFTPTRVVCQNTLNAALKGEKNNCIRIRHTQNAINKLEEAENTLRASIEFYEEFETKVQRLAQTRMRDAQATEAIEIMFGCDSDEEKEKASTRTKNLIDKVKTLTQIGTGNKPWEGTAWGVYNAATEYADHFMVVRGARGEDETKSTLEAKDKILMSTWFGAAAQFKAKAMNAIDTVLAR